MRIQLIKFAFISLISAILLTGCGSEPSPPPPPTAAVTVVTLRSVPVLLTRELPGRTTPFLVAEVRPQASGIVERRLFTEGSLVKAGEPLYQIDDASYRADASSARASLARAEAAQTSARLAAKRIAELAAIDAVSAQDHENAVAALRQAQADVGVAQRRAARADSSSPRATARIDCADRGRIGKSSVTQGALVTANQDRGAGDDPATRSDLCRPDAVQQRAAAAAQADRGRQRLERMPGLPVRILLEDGSRTRTMASWPSPMSA
jgi:membrane fusion protein (multidrug efflux system)